MASPFLLKKETKVKRNLGKMKKLVKARPKFLIVAVVMTLYFIKVDTNIQRRARLLADHREMTRDLLTLDLGSGECDIQSPTEDAQPREVNSTTTLLASYPGSGKRFTWTVIKALTNTEVADDWNFSEKLYKKPLTVKTSWPHTEGKWSWGRQMRQTLLLIRNPRRAIPSYHTMRFELDYSLDWHSSYLHIEDTYTERPAVNLWETWRDARFDREMDKWQYFYEFWVEGGFIEMQNRTSWFCLNFDIDCHPKDIIDFDHIYKRDPTEDFYKIGRILDSSQNVEVVSDQARDCVFEQVYDKNDGNFHQAFRTHPERPSQYNFTVNQLHRMMNRTMDMRDKFSNETFLLDRDNIYWDQNVTEGYVEGEVRYGYLDPLSKELVRILNNYIDENKVEYDEYVDTWLEQIVEWVLGDSDCTLYSGVELNACEWMKVAENHDEDKITDGEFKYPFPYNEYLQERMILAMMYQHNGGSNWNNNTGWLSNEDHCAVWNGVTCNEEDKVLNRTNILSLDVSGNNFAGPIFDISGLTKLEELFLDLSDLSPVPDAICEMNNLEVTGDEESCYDVSTMAGCCDKIRAGPGILATVTADVLGDADCNTLDAGGDINTCQWMQQGRAAHPAHKTNDLIEYLTDRINLARIYQGGFSLTNNTGWLESEDHCEWAGVTCNDDMLNANALNAIIVNTFGDDNCTSFEDVAETNACDWFKTSTHHPFNTDIETMTYLKERLILAKMFYANGGDEWTTKYGWLGNGDHCNWYGVTCDSDSKVEELSLTDNNLTGAMTDLSALISVNSIVLDVNNLTGPIPSNVCAISSTIFLQVDDDLCEDPGTATGCCDKVRSGDVTLDEVTANILGTADCSELGLGNDKANQNACVWMEEELNHPLKDVNAHTTAYLTDRLLLAQMYYANGGATWNNNDGWLSNESHCIWTGIDCDEKAHVTNIILPNNNLSGSMTDLSALSSISNIVLDVNDLTGPIPNNVCAISSSIFLQVDDDLCTDPSTAAGCCDKVRTGDVTIDGITADVLGKANCQTILNAADKNACVWMEEEFNHPLNEAVAHTSAYLTDRLLLARMYYTNGGDAWTNKDNWLNNLSHCDWNGIVCDSSSHVTDVSLGGNNLSGSMTDLSGLSAISRMTLDLNGMAGPIPTAICNKVAAETLYLVGDDYICNDSATPTGCCSASRGGQSISDTAVSLLGTSDCTSLSNPADISTCQWMEDRSHHPVHDPAADVLNHITQRYNLVRLYYANGGASWNDSTGWLSEGDHCTTWFGVTCDANLKADALSVIVSNTLGSADCSSFSDTSDKQACEWLDNPTNHPVATDSNTYGYIKERLILAKMFYANGGDGWTNKASWLNSGSQCDWYGVSCSANFSVTGVNLADNNLSGSMTDLSALSSISNIVLDVNDLTGPIPNNVCAISSSIFLQVDDDLCTDPSTAAGCCDKVRTGDVTIDEITADVLGTANCQTILNAADKNACVWMEEEFNHPLNEAVAHTSEYLTDRLLLARMYYTNGGDAWTNKDNWLNNLSHCDWNGILCDSSSHVTDVNLSGNNLSGSMTDISALSSLSYIDVKDNNLTGPIPTAICNKFAITLIFIVADESICLDPDTEVGCCSN